jgi:hypothetical protein
MTYVMNGGLGDYATRGECESAEYDACFDTCQATCGYGSKDPFCVTNCVLSCVGGRCNKYPAVLTMQKGLVPSSIPGVAKPAPYQLSSEDFPWKAYSSATEQLQYSLNQKLSHDGLCTISTDGKLGPGTCGAAKHYGAAPPSCESFTKPKACPAGGGGEGGGGGGGGLAPAEDSNLLLWLAGGAAVLGVGWLLLGKKRMRANPKKKHKPPSWGKKSAATRKKRKAIAAWSKSPQARAEMAATRKAQRDTRFYDSGL